MVKILQKMTTVVCVVLSGLLVMSSPASAGNGHDDFPPPAGGDHPKVVSDSGYQPLDSTKGDEFEVNGCGTTLTVLVLADKVVERDVTYKNGDVKQYFKGKYVVRISAPNGRSVKQDNSGPYTVTEYAASGDLLYDLGAPGAIYPFNDAEAKAFERAGLPSVFAFEKGRLQFYEEADESYAKVLEQPKHVTNLCRALGIKA